MSQDNALTELPPSAKLVYKILEYHDGMTQKEIIEASMLSPRTVRYALDRLQTIDVISENVYIPDARQNLYEIDINDGGECGIEAK